MWQIYAMMAKDHIDSELHEAERRRRDAGRIGMARPRRAHLTDRLRRAGRASSRTV